MNVLMGMSVTFSTFVTLNDFAKVMRSRVSNTLGAHIVHCDCALTRVPYRRNIKFITVDSDHNAAIHVTDPRYDIITLYLDSKNPSPRAVADAIAMLDDRVHKVPLVVNVTEQNQAATMVFIVMLNKIANHGLRVVLTMTPTLSDLFQRAMAGYGVFTSVYAFPRGQVMANCDSSILGADTRFDDQLDPRNIIIPFFFGVTVGNMKRLVHAIDTAINDGHVREQSVRIQVGPYMVSSPYEFGMIKLVSDHEVYPDLLEKVFGGERDELPAWIMNKLVINTRRGKNWIDRIWTRNKLSRQRERYEAALRRLADFYSHHFHQKITFTFVESVHETSNLL